MGAFITGAHLFARKYGLLDVIAYFGPGTVKTACLRRAFMNQTSLRWHKRSTERRRETAKWFCVPAQHVTMLDLLRSSRRS
jgi:hypothetical protein